MTTKSETKVRTTMIGLAAGVLLLAGTGCASWYMVGSEPHSGPPRGATATYKAPTCTELSNGKELAGPKDATYYVTREGDKPVLFEIEGSGSGAKITNHWKDGEGTHFFTYVKGRQGWQYDVPEDPSAPAKRLVFTQYTVEESAGVMKPAGKPLVACALVPQR